MKTIAKIVLALLVCILGAGSGFVARADELTETQYTVYMREDGSIFLQADLPDNNTEYAVYTPVTCDVERSLTGCTLRNVDMSYVRNILTVDSEYQITKTLNPGCTNPICETKSFFEPDEYAAYINKSTGYIYPKKSLVVDEYAEFADIDISKTSTGLNIQATGYGDGDFAFSKTNKQMCKNIFSFTTPIYFDLNKDTYLTNTTDVMNTSDDLFFDHGSYVLYQFELDGSITLLSEQLVTHEGMDDESSEVRTLNVNIPDPSNIRIWFSATKTTNDFKARYAAIAVNSPIWELTIGAGDYAAVINEYEFCKNRFDPKTNAAPVYGAGDVITGHEIFSGNDLLFQTIAYQEEFYENIYRYIRLFWYETDDPDAVIPPMNSDASKDICIKQGYSGNFLVTLYDDFQGIIDAYPTAFEAVRAHNDNPGKEVLVLYDDFINDTKYNGVSPDQDPNEKVVFTEQLLIPEDSWNYTFSKLPDKPTREQTQTWSYSMVKALGAPSWYYFFADHSWTKGACGLYGLPNNITLADDSYKSFTYPERHRMIANNVRNLTAGTQELIADGYKYLRITIDVRVFETPEAKEEDRPMIELGNITPLHLYYPLYKVPDNDNDPSTPNPDDPYEDFNNTPVSGPGADSDMVITIIR